ncbi:uncharacterized protein LOC141587957 [Silene latifolia]|uniref:uncharacterized protein LOC141587957 n=1 Tax=Silene latifolia TaxID=37657 RepID=UPI003D781914
MVGEDKETGASSDKTGLHPVYSVNNILHKIRMLDGVKITYSSWVKLFILLAKRYKIYGSISKDLLVRILETDSTAHAAWTRLKNHFYNNKGARAAALEHEFTNLSLEKCSSLDDYCQKLKDITSQLNDVGSTVNDQRLVLHLVRGLPSSYDTVGAYINQTLPTFETARSVLQLEEHRRSARAEDAPAATALAAPAASPPNNSGYSDGSNGATNYGQSGRGNHNGKWNGKKTGYKGKGKGGNGWQNQGRGSGNSGGNRPPLAQEWVPTGPPQVLPMLWAVPPCPYPAQAGWVGPWKPQPRSSAPHFAPAPSTFGQQGQAYVASTDGFEPSQLGQAFQAMTLYQPEDTNYYMDTGASLHLTSDSGYTD